jgi:septal ring factor EnvC (AmiA/AmiB activator)
MASPELPDGREFRQMRHDVDDAYRLLTVVYKMVESTREAVGTVSAAQRRHDDRLEEIQQSLDRQAGRTDRTEDNQRQQGERLGQVDTRLGRIEGTQQDQGERLGQVDSRLGRIEGTQQDQGERLEEILTLLRGRSG